MALMQFFLSKDLGVYVKATSALSCNGVTSRFDPTLLYNYYTAVSATDVVKDAPGDMPWPRELKI